MVFPTSSPCYSSVLCICACLHCSDDPANPSNPGSHRLKAQNAKLNGMKAELKRLLAQPLVARGVSTKYITSGSRPIVDDIVRGDCEFLALLQS